MESDIDGKARHQRRMARKKAVVNAGIARATDKRGVIDRADTITGTCKIRHACHTGIQANEGIELWP